MTGTPQRYQARRCAIQFGRWTLCPNGHRLTRPAINAVAVRACRTCGVVLAMWGLDPGWTPFRPMLVAELHPVEAAALAGRTLEAPALFAEFGIVDGAWLAPRTATLDAQPQAPHTLTGPSSTIPEGDAPARGLACHKVPKIGVVVSEGGR